MYAELLIHKILALGLMEKLTAQTEVGVFQQDMTVPTQQYPHSPATFVFSLGYNSSSRNVTVTAF
jgi:hypothetical protein